METNDWEVESKKNKSDLPVHLFIMQKLLIILSIATLATFFGMIVIF